MSQPDDWGAAIDPLDDDTDQTRFDPADLAAARRVRSVLADPATWQEPPRALRASVLALAAAEGQAPAGPTRDSRERVGEAGPEAEPRRGGTAPGTDASVVTPLAPRRARHVGRWLVTVAGVAAAGILAAVLLWPSSPAPSSTYVLAGGPLVPNATATATLEPRSAGVAITLTIKGLPPAGPGTYYAGWLRGPRGSVPVGSFHWRKGGIPIDLWSGVDPSVYPELVITRESEGGPSKMSKDVVLLGRVTGPSSG